MKDLSNNNLPDFLIVGAAKSGTTSLYHYLLDHPEINLSKRQKEGRYFSNMPNDFKGPGDHLLNQSIPQSKEEYFKLFDNIENSKVKGDISPDYLYYANETIKKIQEQFLEEPKIIIILRNPIDRAFSQFMHFSREKREILQFEEALKNERKRKSENWEWAWRYKDVGLYYNQVKLYLDNFKSCKIILFEDLKKDAQQVVIEVCDFLDVSKIEINKDKIYNKSGIPQNNIQTQFYNKFVKNGNVLSKTIKLFIPESKKRKIKHRVKELLFDKYLEKQKMKSGTRLELIEFFSDDIIKLESLIQRDLSHWLK